MSTPVFPNPATDKVGDLYLRQRFGNGDNHRDIVIRPVAGGYLSFDANLNPVVSAAGTETFGDGTAAAPAIAFASDSDTGFFSAAANFIGIATGGAVRARWGANGLYGPTVDNYIQLDAAGAISVVAAGTNQPLTLSPSGTGGILSGTANGNYRATNGGSDTPMSLKIKASSAATAFVGVDGTGTVASLDYIFNNSGGVPIRGATMFAVASNVTAGSEAAYLVLATLTGGAGAAEAARITENGNLLIGTTTNGVGKIQLATATTSAGGIAFGTDLSLYRTGSGILDLNGTSGCALRIVDTGTVRGSIGSSGSTLTVSSVTGNLVLASNNITTLTLDSSNKMAIASTSAVSGIRTATATLDFPSIAADGGTQDLTVTVTGAAVGDAVNVVENSASSINAGVTLKAWVSATNTVTVRATNTTTGAIDPASASYRVTVTSF